MKIYGKNSKGKKVLITVPDWDTPVPPNGNFGDGPSSSGPNIVEDNNLVLYLDAANADSYSGTGNIWYDLTSNNNDATINSATYNSNGYFDFNGTSNFMTIPYNASLDFRTTNFTIQTWFQPQKIQSGLIAMGDWGDSNHVYSISYTMQYHFRAEFYINSTSIVKNTSARINLNTWANVAITRNGNTVTIYTNGEILSATPGISNPATIGTISGGTPDLIIGKEFITYSNTNFFYGGLASNILMYNRSLSANEVQQNYNAFSSRYF